MEMPRSGLAGAVTCSPSACSRLITSFQLEPSALAPCTRTTEGWDPSCWFVLMACSFRTRFFPVAGQPFHRMHGGTIRSLARTSENSVMAKFAEHTTDELQAL